MGIFIGLILLLFFSMLGFILFIIVKANGKGKGSGNFKGGVVVTRFSADMEILDPEFKGCKPKAKYSIFKPGSPDKIDIEVENLFIPIGDHLEFLINGKTLANVPVEPDREAEFECWSDEGKSIPVIKAGDEVVIKYQNCEVIKGIFQLR